MFAIFSEIVPDLLTLKLVLMGVMFVTLNYRDNMPCSDLFTLK